MVVVDNGDPIMATLRSEHVSMDDLMAAARSQGIERFAEIRLAVLETNGRISFFTEDARSGAAESPPVS